MHKFRYKLNGVVSKLSRDSFFKDSFYAVVGNGLGQFLLLASGVLIARFLGKDIYGEYGVVKTNMFYMAGFATFGLVYSSTRFISKYKKENKSQVIGIIRTSTIITAIFSSLVAVIIVILSEPLANYLNIPDLQDVFKYLSVIIVLKALNSTSTGILSGLGLFKNVAVNLLLSGVTMLILCVPLTCYGGLKGALCSLLVCQFVNMVTNYFCIYRESMKYPVYYKSNQFGELVKFSFPIALQEISYSVCNWAGILFLTKLSSIGEVGIYSATAQWNAVIMFIPGLLANVVLSHLSGSLEKERDERLKKIMLVYLACTLIPFVAVYCFTPVIVSLYGADYSGMGQVIRLMVFATIPTCLSDVYKSEWLAIGKPWILFLLRMTKDVVFLSLTYFLLTHFHGANGSFFYALSNVCAAIYFLLVSMVVYKILFKIKD